MGILDDWEFQLTVGWLLFGAAFWKKADKEKKIAV